MGVKQDASMKGMVVPSDERKHKRRQRSIVHTKFFFYQLNQVPVGSERDGEVRWSSGTLYPRVDRQDTEKQRG